MIFNYSRNAADTPYSHVISLHSWDLDFQGLYFWRKPLYCQFSKGKIQRHIREEGLQKDWPGSESNCGPTPTPFDHAPGPSTLPPHPIIKILLDGLGGMGQQSTGSRYLLWIQLPKSISIYRSVQVLSITCDQEATELEKNLISDNYLLYKQASWTNFHEAKVASRASRFEERLSLKFSPQDVTSRM